MGSLGILGSYVAELCCEGESPDEGVPRPGGVHTLTSSFGLFLNDPVSVKVSIAVIKHHGRKQLEEKRMCFSLGFLDHTPQLRGVRAATWGHELMWRPQRSAAYWLASLSSFLPSFLSLGQDFSL